MQTCSLVDKQPVSSQSVWSARREREAVKSMAHEVTLEIRPFVPCVSSLSSVKSFPRDPLPPLATRCVDDSRSEVDAGTCASVRQGNSQVTQVIMIR